MHKLDRLSPLAVAFTARRTVLANLASLSFQVGDDLTGAQALCASGDEMVMDSRDTPADPGAIDLERVKFLLHRHSILTRYEANPLIAAVEEWQTRAEAAEARVVELEGALEGLYNANPTHIGESLLPAKLQKAGARARAALSTTSAEAMERARAVDEATAMLSSYYIAEMMGDALPTGGRSAALKEIGAFLAKLKA